MTGETQSFFKTLPFCLKSSEIVYSGYTAVSEQLLLASTWTTAVMHTLFPGTASSLPGAHRQSGFRISRFMVRNIDHGSYVMALMLGRLNPQKQGGFFSKLQGEEGAYKEAFVGWE